jgi:hypothetical protein
MSHTPSLANSDHGKSPGLLRLVWLLDRWQNWNNKIADSRGR